MFKSPPPEKATASGDQQEATEHLKQRLIEVQKQVDALRNNDPGGSPQVTLHDNDQREIAAVANFKLIPFWKNKSHIWFIQIEAEFETKNIRSDNTKYNAVITALDEVALEEVSDIIGTPPAQDKYNNLKQSLIKRFTDYTSRQLHKLLNELELGDKKPS
ncbi:hypothetical protein KPH14_009771 [Odynerus spinipes]|uniref:DUF7041 domain-containing protein n=1 Tax=Odynerus spinipes TaxID=1348599 RepID=A0AAD9RFS0_9HYME|nr:hypothetical protein KPH14_009771 [Odynerus spinipes]